MVYLESKQETQILVGKTKITTIKEKPEGGFNFIYNDKTFYYKTKATAYAASEKIINKTLNLI